MRVSIVLLLAIGVVPCFTACSTAPANTGATAAQAEAQPAKTRADRDSALRRLQKGMTADQVRAAWGEPGKIEPMPASTGLAEVWTYTFSFLGPVRQVQTGETTYDRPNPLTGLMETIKEPVFSTEQTTIEQIVELLFYDGRLTEWKQSRESERRYD